ncbi:substrate-binding domain-containing protein, partial [Streptomyces sp. NPDC054863]
MGRHSLPDEHGPDGSRSARPRVRTRTVLIATSLVLAVAAGTTYAVRSGMLGSDSCGDGTVRLGVVASPDIAPALRAAADEVRRTRAKSDGNCLDVRVTARDSAGAADAFATGRGTEGYQVWIPDADMWPQRVRSSGTAPLTAAGNVASSPLGVATVPAAGKTLGWPAKTYTWAELTAATTSGNAPRLGTADPARNATGLIALTSVGQSASASDPEGTKSAAVAKMLSKRMSDSEGRLLNTLARDDSPSERADPRRNQALFLSEQAAFAHNAAGRTPKLQLFYPKDGTALLDYPYTLLDEPGMTTDQSRAAMRFQAFLGQSEGRRVLAGHGFRVPGRPADEKVVRTAGGSAPQPYVRTA